MVPHWDFFSQAEACRPKEEKSNISLELSLSCDHHHASNSNINAAATAIDRKKGKGIYHDKENLQLEEIKFGGEAGTTEVGGVSLKLCLGLGVADNSFMSKTKTPPHRDHDRDRDRGNYHVGECSSSSSSKLSDNSISLELSLSSGSGTTYPQTHHHEQQHNLLIMNQPKVAGVQPNLGSKKRERMEKPCTARKVPPCKKIKQDNALVVVEEAAGDPWRIKKQLLKSDVDHLARLMLSLKKLREHVFPCWNADVLARIKEGVPVSVWDCDTNTQHDLVFRQWNKGANVLQSNWTKQFVKRRGLKTGDTIGLFWDVPNSRFNFSLLNRAPIN